MIRALAITVSNRASAGVYEDRSGPVLVELLRTAGCDVVDGPLVIPDGEAVEQVLRDSVTAGYDVAVTTGGTGLTPTDQTPEMTRRVIDREIPGIAEALRSAGAAAGVPSAILSRGLAGVASRTLIVNLPGSSGGVKDGMNVLRPILVHAGHQHGRGHGAHSSNRRRACPRERIALRYRLCPRLDGTAFRGMIDCRGTHPRVAGHPHRAGPA
jgi:molybdenum cofactor synthesis domain-containing protein